MSLRLLRTAVELAQPSAPTYLPVAVERRRRRRAAVGFAVALVETVLTQIVSGGIEVDAPPPRGHCIAWAVGNPVLCADPFALAAPDGVRG
ncbi:hypothetical protein [Microbacterium sp. RU33B]|uniref:hypothetical protein n=1 Tax=Microbacterium sp. RU33B TaxID=1907390 RepID=UPI000962DA03|nr:hypothetical protein [Microbacterium sp. RU33B]SIT67895.1 hypothetical protein SAMN05880545_0264 [Microbacterium sp. RU33B]